MSVCEVKKDRLCLCISWPVLFHVLLLLSSTERSSYKTHRHTAIQPGQLSLVSPPGVDAMSHTASIHSARPTEPGQPSRGRHNESQCFHQQTAIHRQPTLLLLLATVCNQRARPTQPGQPSPGRRNESHRFHQQTAIHRPPALLVLLAIICNQ